MTIDEKYLNAVHYIINTCQNPKILGSVKLNKILLYADGALLKKNGTTITGDHYIKMPLGPVPQNIQNVEDELVAQNKISIRKDIKPHLFFSLEEPDISDFSPYEIDILSHTTYDICNNYTSTEISDKSHTIDWKIVPIGGKIDLYNYFIAEEEEVTEEDICIAQTLI